MRNSSLALGQIFLSITIMAIKRLQFAISFTFSDRIDLFLFFFFSVYKTSNEHFKKPGLIGLFGFSILPPYFS